MDTHELDDFPVLKSLQHKHWFEPPEGYFAQLSQHLPFQLQIMQDIDYQDIPTGYFAHFPDKLMARLAEEEIAPILYALPKRSMLEEVPSDYFEAFSERISRKLADLPAADETPILAQLPKSEETYPEADAAYFEGFYGDLAKKLPSSKTISAFAWQKYVRYGMSLAAAIALIVSFVWFNPMQKSGEKDSVEIDLSSLSHQEIVQALASEEFDEATLASELDNVKVETLQLEDLSDAEVEELLNEVDAEDFEL